MISIKESLVYFQEIRSQFAADLDAYQTDRFTGKDCDGQRVDTTKDTIADLKRRIARLDGIIAAYKEHT